MMKKVYIHKLHCVYVLVFAIAPILFSACRKNTDCDVEISVLDGNTKSPVPGASVHIHPPLSTKDPLKEQDQTAATDASGIASFTFKLEAKLQVDVTPPAPYTAPPQITVDLKPGGEVSETIEVY